MDDKFEGFLYAVAGGLVALLTKWLIDLSMQRLERARHAAYLAVRVVYELERFVAGCLVVARDTGPSHEDFDRYEFAKMPAFVPQDLGVDWKSINVRLTYSVLNLVSDRDAVETRVSEYWSQEWSDIHSAADMRSEEYMSLGLKAADLAQQLRKVGKLPAPEIDPTIELKKLQADRARRDAEFAEHQRALADAREVATVPIRA